MHDENNAIFKLIMSIANVWYKKHIFKIICEPLNWRQNLITLLMYHEIICVPDSRFLYDDETWNLPLNFIELTTSMHDNPTSLLFLNCKLLIRIYISNKENVGCYIVLFNLSLKENNTTVCTKKKTFNNSRSRVNFEFIL